MSWLNNHFINPYNFVPLSGNDVSRGELPDRMAGGLLSGVIHYSIKTKTPLFIPNTSNDKALGTKAYTEENGERREVEHNSYEFFSYTDLSERNTSEENLETNWPVIPGSEVRGMFRAAYEILTNSCMSAIDDDEFLCKRTAEAYQSGLIKKRGNTYTLYPAKDCLLRTSGENDYTNIDYVWDPSDPSLEDKQAKIEKYGRKCYRQENLREGEKVWVTVEFRERGKPLVTELRKANGARRRDEKIGYVIKGEDGPDMNDGSEKLHKHSCHIFLLGNQNNQNNGISLTPIDIKKFEGIMEVYDQESGRYHEYKKQYEAFVKRTDNGAEEYFPIYYSFLDRVNKRYIVLSPACITREAYNMKLGDMIKTHKTCSSKREMCPACALFGTINKDTEGNSFSVATRIRFSDLHTVDERDKGEDETPDSLFMEPITLRPLSTPKISNMEFYVKRPTNAVFWTYDYYVDCNGAVHVYNNRNAGEINGRKFYWHNLNPDLTSQEPDILNTTVRPLKSDVTFIGKMFFDNITKEELNQLIYLLDCGDTGTGNIDDKTHGYKLGHGKPLGLGSIAATTDCIIVYDYRTDSINHTVTRSEEPYAGYVDPDFDKKIVENFKKMTCFKAAECKDDENKSLMITYPKVDDENVTEIFKWFEKNHKLQSASLNRRENRFQFRNEPAGMGQYREQMRYQRYMEPMEPVLQDVGLPEFLTSEQEERGHRNNGGQGNNNRNNNRSYNGQRRNNNRNNNRH